MHLYLWQRLFAAPELGAAWSATGGLALGILCLATPAGMLLGRALPRPAGTLVGLVAYVWLGLAALLFFGLAAAELVRGALWLVGAVFALDVSPTDVSRAVAVAVAGGAGLAALYGVGRALGPVPVRRVEVELARLPASLSGLRIVQLSDLHVGPTRGRSFVADVVARVNALAPDVVAITGDLVDGSVERLRPHTAPLADLRARHGVFFVTGNHEYYSGADAWVRELERLGVRVLRNERVAILGPDGAALDLAGVDDWSAFGPGHGRDLERALAGRDPRREVVLLAHQPKQVHEAAALGVGLQLSGHTHGGQIFPWTLFVRLDQPTVAGLDRIGTTQIYTSRGTGYWGPPMRVG
ncbi:MAG: metallophosphoesterase, partial [Myxococcales bacterium]|nr:metallophosphoesterase [Myxococcales bacterium]